MDTNFKSSDFVSWQAEKELLVKRCISALLDIMTLDEAGNPQTTEGNKLEIFIRILISSLQFPEVLLHDWDVKHGLIYKAAFALKKNSVQDIHQFQFILAKEVEQYLCQPIKIYKVLLPLHAVGDCLTDKLQVTLLSETMEFRSWESLKEEVDTEEFFKKERIFRYKDEVPIDTNFTPVVMNAEGRNEQEAFDKADRKFELLRTILNILSVQFRFKQQWGGYPTAYSEYLPAPVFGIFQTTGEFIDLFYNETKYPEYKEKKITKEHIEGVFKIAGMIHEPANDDDSMKIFIEALEMYGQAIDTAEWRLSFIFLWQIFELMTLKARDKIQEVDVIKRVSGVLSLNQPLEDMLQIMYSSRNLLVHESQFPSGNSIAMKEFGFLKMLVDRFISKSYDLILMYPTIPELSIYYSNFAPLKRK